ncbi:hypothetical protein ACIDI_90c00010 [Acidiphilium sp. JA12-A1]|nr:hypothetical protein ACIDI_90c00010 [Acidiphilium sp. JA12-A1]
MRRISAWSSAHAHGDGLGTVHLVASGPMIQSASGAEMISGAREDGPCDREGDHRALPRASSRRLSRAMTPPLRFLAAPVSRRSRRSRKTIWVMVWMSISRIDPASRATPCRNPMRRTSSRLSTCASRADGHGRRTARGTVQRRASGLMIQSASGAEIISCARPTVWMTVGMTFLPRAARDPVPAVATPRSTLAAAVQRRSRCARQAVWVTVGMTVPPHSAVRNRPYRASRRRDL